MRFLVVGLGSMGKRRIRCLKALSYSQVAGFDLREDRRSETLKKYEVPVFSNFQEAMTKIDPTCLVISVPPDIHHEYMKQAIKNKKHFFVEASVVDTDMNEITAELKKKNLVGAPSATLLFHPAIQTIQQILKEGTLGKISNVIYHSGQYLPDWHTYEKVSEFYVSNPITGGAREIVPFELTWLTHIFGFPQEVAGHVCKTINIEGAEKIDDTYNFLFKYEKMLMSITIDVVSRHGSRRLLINGDQGQLVWSWDDNFVSVYDGKLASWKEVPYQMMHAEKGYNANIGENMYIDEVKCFIDSVTDSGKPFINDMENDHKVLKVLYAIEEASKKRQVVEFGG